LLLWRLRENGAAIVLAEQPCVSFFGDRRFKRGKQFA